MIVIRHTDGSVSINLTKDEADDLTFEIAVTDTVWNKVPSLYEKFSDPRDCPLSALHRAIHAA